MGEFMKSFSHIRELLVIADDFERFFYETEYIKCKWPVPHP